MDEIQTHPPFKPLSHPNSFEYAQNKASLDELNFVYLMDKKALMLFKSQCGLMGENMHEEELGSATAIEPVDNTALLNYEEMSKMAFKSKNPRFKQLNNILADVEEEDIEFLTRAAFEIVKKKLPHFKEIKKVLYKLRG